MALSIAVMNKSEQQRIAIKKEQWDIAINKFWKWCGKVWKECKYNFKNMIDWYFFYKPESKGNKSLHIFLWILYTLAGLRIFRFI